MFLFRSALLVLTMLSCRNDGSDSSEVIGEPLPYDIISPTAVFELPNDLYEVSGLAYSTAKGKLLAINDELGVVYYIDQVSGVVSDRFEYGKSNDYEGIAYQDGIIYTVESNSNISRIDEGQRKLTNVIKGGLSSRNNIEGLVHDAKTGKLLLAAKGNSQQKGNRKGIKSIFQMNLRDGSIDPTPLVSINLESEIEKIIVAKDLQDSLIQKQLFARVNDFAPSAIAISPLDGNLYVLSSRGQLLVVLNSAYSLTSVVLLDKSKHRQPEGITFDNAGRLYIANEGDGAQAVIYKYMFKG